MSSGSLASVSRHTLRQLKFILPGGLVTYYLDTHHVFWKIFEGESQTSEWARGISSRTITVATLGLALLTVVLFIYILLLPLIQGEQPNYRHWRQSGVLSTVIPILTASIVIGWSLLTYTLGRWSNLGYLEGVVGASGLYALCFGLLGLTSTVARYLGLCFFHMMRMHPFNM